MSIFFRILSYARNIGQKLTLFFLFSILGIIFGAFNIILVIPMLKVLFKQDGGTVVVPELPSFTLSSDYVITVFNHYFLRIVQDRGQLDALLFVCALIVACVV